MTPEERSQSNWTLWLIILTFLIIVLGCSTLMSIDSMLIEGQKNGGGVVATSTPQVVVPQPPAVQPVQPQGQPDPSGAVFCPRWDGPNGNVGDLLQEGTRQLRCTEEGGWVYVNPNP